jgi:hypothetical protein
LAARSAPDHGAPALGIDTLRVHAESLIRELADESAVLADGTESSLQLIVDGYAHVLALDVDCLRLERELVRLAESGDPRVASELRELSKLLRSAMRTSEELRKALSVARARVEGAGGEE